MSQLVLSYRAFDENFKNGGMGCVNVTTSIAIFDDISLNIRCNGFDVPIGLLEFFYKISVTLSAKVLFMY